MRGELVEVRGEVVSAEGGELVVVSGSVCRVRM